MPFIITSDDTSNVDICTVLPEATSADRGRTIILDKGDDGDFVYMCVKAAGGGFEWRDVSGAASVNS